MIRKKNGEVEWLEFELLAGVPEIVHGVFLRHGGVSQGPYRSLSMGSRAGDDPSNIAENRRRVLRSLGIEQCVEGNQVHSDEVMWVKEGNGVMGPFDGLMTDQKEIGLMVKHADCQAAIFYDPVRKGIANVHAGWRGQVKNVYRKTVQKMNQSFGTKPEDLFVCISPSLGPKHAEFIHYRRELPEEFWKFQVRPMYFDLWAIARHQLQEAGVPSHQIEIAGICTYSEEKDFFSCRRDKAYGNHATIVMINSTTN